MKIKTYFELEVWKHAHELALQVFQATERFPKIDEFGIVAQVRRSCASVPANIAEGYGRGTTKEFLRSLQIARGEFKLGATKDSATAGRSFPAEVSREKR